MSIYNADIYIYASHIDIHIRYILLLINNYCNSIEYQYIYMQYGVSNTYVLHINITQSTGGTSSR